jgi:quercetin dioxygenase-like cupin family protein
MLTEMTQLTGVMAVASAAQRQTRRSPMRRRSILAAVILILAFALPAAVAADDPPAPTTRHAIRVDGLPVAGSADVLAFIVESPPGAQTPPHTHPGLVVATTLEGEVTLTTGGVEKTYKVGEVLTEPPGVAAVARNRGTVRALQMGSMVIPQGAAPSTAEPGASPPAAPALITHYLHRTAAIIPAGPYEVAHTLLDFAPGAQTPPHTHPGQVVSTVLAGEIAFTTGGATTVYMTGETFVELPGVVGQARNAGSAPATVKAVYLLPKGAPLSSPVAPAPPSTGTGGTLPGLPSTGAGGGQDHLARPAPLGLAALGASMMIACGWVVRRGEATRRR